MLVHKFTIEFLFRNYLFDVRNVMASLVCGTQVKYEGSHMVQAISCCSFSESQRRLQMIQLGYFARVVDGENNVLAYILWARKSFAPARATVSTCFELPKEHELQTFISHTLQVQQAAFLVCEKFVLQSK